MLEFFHQVGPFYLLCGLQLMASIEVTVVEILHRVVIVRELDVVLEVKVVIARDNLLVYRLGELGLTFLLPLEIILEVEIVLFKLANGRGLYESESIGKVEKSLAEIVRVIHCEVLDLLAASSLPELPQILVGSQALLSVHRFQNYNTANICHIIFF